MKLSARSAGLALAAACLASSAPADAFSTADRYLGESLIRDIETREAAASVAAGMLMQAHSRIGDALLSAPDENLLNHLRTSTGELPPATSPFSPFPANERSLYHEQRIESRACGRWLVTYVRPDAAGMAGWLKAGEIWTAGRFAIVKPSGAISRWGRGAIPDPDGAIAACGLPAGSPAKATRWRAPAAERRTAVRTESRIDRCPAGEVGTGVRETRTVRTVRNGHGTVLPDESTDLTDQTLWSESGRDCRTPRTGRIVRPIACAPGEPAHEMTSFPWKERQVFPDGWSVGDALPPVEIGIDWANGHSITSLCPGTPDTVQTRTVLDHPTRGRTCDQEHGTSRDWIAGSVTHRRERRTTTVDFPNSWCEAPEPPVLTDGSVCSSPRADERIVSLEPWSRYRDDCRYERPRTSTQRRAGTCPEGWTGTTTDIYRRSWTQITYAGARPYRSNYIKAGTDSGWVYDRTSDNCEEPPPPDPEPDPEDPPNDGEGESGNGGNSGSGGSNGGNSGNSGSSNDDDDRREDQGHYDPVTNKYYDKKCDTCEESKRDAPGGKIHDTDREYEDNKKKKEGSSKDNDDDDSGNKGSNDDCCGRQEKQEDGSTRLVFD